MAIPPAPLAAALDSRGAHLLAALVRHRAVVIRTDSSVSQLLSGLELESNPTLAQQASAVERLTRHPGAITVPESPPCSANQNS